MQSTKCPYLIYDILSASTSVNFFNSNVSIRSSKPGSVKKELIRTKPYIHDNCAEMNKT